MAYNLVVIHGDNVAVSAEALSLENVLTALRRLLVYEETGDFDVHIRATPAPEARPQLLTVTPLRRSVPADLRPSEDARPRVRLRRFQNDGLTV